MKRAPGTALFFCSAAHLNAAGRKIHAIIQQASDESIAMSIPAPPAGQPPKTTLRVLRIFEIDPKTEDVLTAKYWVYAGDEPLQSFDYFKEAVSFYEANAHRFTVA